MCQQRRETKKPCRWKRQGFEFGSLRGETKQSWFQPATKRVPLSRSACDDVWRRLTAKRFFFNESVSVSSATPCFSSAPTAIADIVIAAESAASTLAGSKGGVPMDATSKARKAGSTTATVRGITGAVKDKPA